MTNKKEMLKEVLRNIRPSKEELVGMNNGVKEFVNKINKKIKQSKINASLFVGGSFAKNTLIKKNEYDVDVFIRFDKKHKNEDISKLTEKLLGDEKNVSLIHGSRDYFSVKAKPNFLIEIIPVLNVKTPDEAENITDLSYSHVKYIKKNVKKDVLDEILLAKAFCHANKCYGAESYIKGFSGYSLELLIYYYKSFMNFV
ncbi:MAG: nucleotidyltransferase domain-containing protein, partial [Nanoarchaeota archaeon]